MTHPQDAVPKASSRGWTAVAWVLSGLLLVLLMVHLTVGDRAPAGEWLTVWPPLLWWAPALVVSAVPLVRATPRARWTLAAALLLFALLLIEWRPLLRFGSPAESPDTVRVVTWNVGGGYPSNAALLEELAGWQPDLVLLQESPDGAAGFLAEDLIGHWDGWTWTDAGDCGVLSRWPVRVLATRSVGPWEAPQALAVDRPDGDALLVVNVRLMLPSLRLFPVSASARADFAQAHRQRVGQYAALVDLVRELQAAEPFAATIVGGDFNVDAGARSLAPIRAVAHDVWPTAGRGWGATITREFPVARIDHLHVAGGLRPTSARVAKSSLSDHRPLVVVLEPDAASRHSLADSTQANGR